MSEYRREGQAIDYRMSARDFGFMSVAEKERIDSARIAIAGVGGDGFQLGYSLVQNGFRNFSIADPEVFERENANRVPGATMDAIGRPKAEVFAEWVRRIRPDAQVDVYKDGVTLDNVSDFIRGATLVLDESELTRLEVGAALHREARAHKVPAMFIINVAFGAAATSFHPESKNTFERMMGIPEDMPLDEVAEQPVSFARCVPYVPSYLDVDTLEAVYQHAPLPSIKQGVDVAAGLGGTEVFLHTVSGLRRQRRAPTWYPKFRYMDAYTGKSGTRRAHYHRGVALASLKKRLGLTPECPYPVELGDE